MINDDTIQESVLVDQLPSNSWFEGFLLRPNGDGIACRTDAPELYSFDPDNPGAELTLIHTFPNATGLIHICELEGHPDEYAVMSAFVNIAEGRFEDFVIWRVRFSSDHCASPIITRIGTVPEAGFCISMLSVDERTLLVADSAKHCIWSLDIPTGATSLLLDDESMAVASPEDFYGLNHIRHGGGYLWFTNSSKGTLGRFPIEYGAEGNGTYGVRATGPVQVVTEDIKDCDGLVLNRDCTAAYTAGYTEGLVWKITIDGATGKGQTSTVMQNLVNPTCLELLYIDDEATLFTVCCGQIENDWVNRGDGAAWSEVAGLSEAVSVTVTISEDAVETN